MSEFLTQKDSPLPASERGPLGLRERKKIAAMRHIQHIAIELFTERGFDAVSVEQIAAAAEVSPSSIYRYFKTKEGIVLRDEYDDLMLDGVRRALAQGTDFWTAVHVAASEVWEGHFITDAAITRARMLLWFRVPALQAEGSLVINEHVDGFARAMVETGRWTFPHARVIVSAIIWSMVATMRNWYDAGAGSDFEDHIAQWLAWIKRSYANPEGDTA